MIFNSTNRKVVVCCRGESLYKYTVQEILDKLKNPIFILVNAVCLVRNWETTEGFVYYGDPRIWNEYKTDIKDFLSRSPGYRLVYPKSHLNLGRKNKADYPEGSISVEVETRRYIDLSKDTISHGSHSGYQAVNLALKITSEQVYTLGMDFNKKNIQEYRPEWISINEKTYGALLKKYNETLDKLFQESKRTVIKL